MQYTVDGTLYVSLARKRNVAVPVGNQTPFFQVPVGGNNEQTVTDISQESYNHQILVNTAQEGQGFTPRCQLHPLKGTEKRTDWKFCTVMWRR
jgi:hypothetical protein